MLLRALFVSFACIVVAQTMLQAAAALALTALHRQSIAAASSAFVDATQRAQAYIANAIVQNAPLSGAVPSPEPTCVVSGDAGCTLVAHETIVVATPEPTACPPAACYGYVQSNDAVGEGRAVATIAASISDAAGEQLAARGGSVVFRTLRVAPYAVAAGATDATLDDGESGAGDTGGITAGVSSGTLIEVVYRNAASGALMPANVWTGLAPGSAPPSAWSP